MVLSPFHRILASQIIWLFSPKHSMGTDEGDRPGTDANGGASQNGGNSNAGTNGDNGTAESGGLMEDVTDGLEQIGEDITGAMDDVADGARTRR